MIPENTHPKELAEEALQTLIPLARKIARHCEGIVKERSVQAFHQELLRIIRSIQMLYNSIEGVKEIMTVGSKEPIVALERELQFILDRILDARGINDDDLTRKILKDELGPHLHSWSRVGIPGLLRSRDS